MAKSRAEGRSGDRGTPGSPPPFAIDRPDRIPKQRYYDADFFELESEMLWSRVWQMACRLEEIPGEMDFVTYEILDQSVIVLRTEDGGARAFHNVCRHRGVRLAQGPGRCENGFTCPFHGWCYDARGRNTFVTQRRSFAPENLIAAELDLTPVRCEIWGGCVWINLDDAAPPLRECMEPAATMLEAWRVEALQTEWWRAFRLPVNWKLAQEAFQEQYHVLTTHPRLMIPGRFPPADGTPFDPRGFVESELHYLRVMSEGMAGMVHARDVQIAEELSDMPLPDTAGEAIATWHRRLNAEVVRRHRERGVDIPDLNELEAQGRNEPMVYCFPHYFVLPMYSSASAYRFRPLGPEETLMEVWSLTRYGEGEEPPRPTPPEVWPWDDPRTPPIPAEDFSNLPRQQKGLHARSFEYMRLSAKAEGHISNLHRLLDGYLAGLPHESLGPGLREVNLNPLERPLVEFFPLEQRGSAGADEDSADSDELR